MQLLWQTNSKKDGYGSLIQTQKEVSAEPLEKQLWKAADKLRKNIDAAEYKHVVLGLIFLKYISDAFEEQHALLAAGKRNMQAQTRKTQTNTARAMCSSFRRILGGLTSFRRLGSRRLAPRWMPPWMPSSVTILAQRRAAQGVCPPESGPDRARRID
ncbi:MAG: type I restriction-modification system subunit M N-terminal domain-containing protein [Pseudomonadales bacterium]